MEHLKSEVAMKGLMEALEPIREMQRKRATVSEEARM